MPVIIFRLLNVLHCTKDIVKVLQEDCYEADRYIDRQCRGRTFSLIAFIWDYGYSNESNSR